MKTGTTAYIVTRGEYSDYHIVGVFSARDAAQSFIERITDRYDNPQIEEYILDAILPPAGMDLWDIVMKRDGASVSAVINGDCFSWERGAIELVRLNRFDGEPHLEILVQCFARDKEHAIKIANEKRAQIIAEGNWREGFGFEKVFSA